MVGTNWKGIGMAQRRWINLQAIELRAEIVGAKNAASSHAQQTHTRWTDLALELSGLPTSAEVWKLRNLGG